MNNKLNLKDRFFHPVYGHGIIIDIEKKTVSKVKIETITLLTECGNVVKFHASETNEIINIKLM